MKRKQTSLVGIALVSWLILTASYFGFHVIKTAYAEMVAPLVYTAEPTIPESRIVETLSEKIDRYAILNNISPKKLHALISCESSYDLKASNINKRESSHGIAQINLYAHPVTLAQAEDADFSLQFIVDHWEKRAKMWYTCSRKHAL